MLTATQSTSKLPLDAIAFCDLLARILYRCLKDQESMTLLFPRASASEQPHKLNHCKQTTKATESEPEDCSFNPLQVLNRTDECIAMA